MYEERLAPYFIMLLVPLGLLLLGIAAAQSISRVRQRRRRSLIDTRQRVIKKARKGLLQYVAAPFLAIVIYLGTVPDVTSLGLLMVVAFTVLIASRF